MKKIYSIFLYFLLPVSGLFAQLSGTYTIGGTSPDYATIQAACDDLVAQGVNGAVTLNLRDGVYAETVVLGDVSGISAMNTITFQAETPNTTNVSITASGPIFTSTVGNIEFIDLIFDQTGINENTLVVSDGNNVVIKRCEFNQATLSTLSGNAISLNNDSTDATNILIDSSSVTNHYRAIDIQGENLSAITINQFMASGAEDRAVNIEAQTNITDIDLDYLTLDSVDRGVYIEVESSGFMKRCQLTNSTINTTGSDGFYAYTHGLSIDSVLIEDCVFNCDDSSVGGTGIEIDAGDADLRWVEIRSVSITDFNDGLTLEADVLLKNVQLDNLNIDVLDEAIYMEGDELAIENVSLTNSVVKSETDEAVYMESNYTIDNVTVRNDSLISQGQDGLYIDAGYAILSNVVIRDNYLMADTAGTGSDYGLYLESDDGDMQNIEVINNKLLGHYGCYLEAYYEMDNIELDSLDVYATYSYGVYLESGYGKAENIRLTNSTILSDDSYGVYLDNDYEDYSNVLLENLTITSDDEGIYIDGDDGGLADFTLKNCSITSDKDYGLYYDGAYTACRDIHIVDNVINAEDEAIYLEHDYGDMFNVTIENNEINTDTDEGIYLESDDGELRNVLIRNNEIEGYEGIYLVGDYGGAYNIQIYDNLLTTDDMGNTGIEIEEAGSDIQITNNRFLAMNDTSYWGYGIEIDGDYNNTSNLLIQNNQIESVDRYGIYMEYVASAMVKGNTISATDTNNLDGIYLEYVYSGPVEISNNEILGTSDGRGIVLEEINHFGNSTTVKNNFISNAGQAFYITDVNNLNIINNSIYEGASKDDLIDASNNSHVRVVNNIFNTEAGVFDNTVLYTDDIDQFTMFDNNTFNFDTAIAVFAYSSDFPGVEYTSLTDFQTATGLALNSFLLDVNFINEPSDLHVNCTETVLNAGVYMDGVNDDIDGQTRKPVPTIGADEIVELNTYDLFAEDAISECFEEYILDATYIPNGTYSWSTGATSQTITVTEPGTYSVTVSDECGQSASDTVVLTKPLPVADFDVVSSFLTGSFSNTSTNADSYTWDFGDGTSSDEFSPIHVFDQDTTFEVTLTAENDCGSSSVTKQVTLTISTGIEDLFLNGNINLYPNPTNGLVYVNIEEYEVTEQLSISVFNAMGKLVNNKEVQANITTIDLSNVEPGLYIVRITDGKEAVNLKAIVK